MRNQNLFQRVSQKTAASLATVCAGALLAVSSVPAYAAAPDYSKFQSVLNATGTLSPDSSTISFPLFRQDLTLTISLDGGMTTFPATPETAAPGYINVKKLATPSTYFFDAAFPALTSELPALEQTITSSGFRITAIGAPVAGLSQEVSVVYIEGTRTEPAASLANSFLGILQTIMQPQLNVTVQQIPTPGNIPMPIPAKFQNLLNMGSFEVLDSSTLLFAIPVKGADADVAPPTIYLGSVPASPSLAVQQSVFISGYGYSVLHALLVLKPGQVNPTMSSLAAAGFTISAASDYFIDDSTRLTFVNAVATSPDQAGFDVQGEALAQILLKIK